jgi:hypothetical protein
MWSGQIAETSACWDACWDACWAKPLKIQKPVAPAGTAESQNVFEAIVLHYMCYNKITYSVTLTMKLMPFM